MNDEKKSFLICPHGSSTLSTFHFWNFKSKEEKTFIKFLREIKEKSHAGCLGGCLFCFPFLLLPSGQDVLIDGAGVT